MARTIFCTFLQRDAEGQDFQLYPGDLGKRIYNEILQRSLGTVAEKTDHADQREKAQHDEPGTPQTAGAGDGELPVRG